MGIIDFVLSTVENSSQHIPVRDLVQVVQGRYSLHFLLPALHDKHAALTLTLAFAFFVTEGQFVIFDDIWKSCDRGIDLGLFPHRCQSVAFRVKIQAYRRGRKGVCGPL